MSMSVKPTIRRLISFLTACSIVGVYALSALLYARPAYADDPASSMGAAIVEVSTAGCRGASTAVSPDPCEGANESANQTDDKLIKPAMQVALLTALLNLATFVFDRLAYEAAIWVATGGEGETPLFNAKTAEEAWKDFGLDIAGDAIGELNESVLDELNIDFDICAPGDSLFKLSIQLGLKQAYQPQEPKCDFQDIRENWDTFIATTAQQAANPSQTVLKAFADGFKPGSNELSAVVGLNLKVHQRVLEAKTSQLFEQVNSEGFKSVTEVITGTVQTPSSVLQDEFQRQIADSNSEPTKLQLQAAIQESDLLSSMFLHVAGVFTNTLLSTLMNKIYTGLFDVQPDVDPFDEELAGITSRDDAANRFSSLITVAPTQVDNYNVLAEFVACPVGPVAVRGINNCVTDSSFVSAVSRAESGVPLTVQEAIDEGLLHGDWPLIPHEGDGIPKNQDPLCYTYGYCYGNLVKMRKARVLPVGWEIAASRNDADNPSTLQEIIDGFDDCGSQGGGIDDSNQWCHLIDPEWVLKYPETQCRALVNGELQISTLSPGRSGACVDTPSCISEANDGSCDGGFGYCVQEGNTWRFRGEECAEQYASCLSFENTFTGESADFLFNTVDQADCDANNAGCEWYRTNKYYDDGGTVDDTSDDTYEWLAGDDDFVTADRSDDAYRYGASPTTYSYATTGGTTVTYDTYAYEDRVYFNNNVEECAEDAAGCSAVYRIGDSLALNVAQNPSFEDDEDEDGQPDSWANFLSAGTLDTSGTYSYYGSNGYTTTSSGVIYQQNIQVAPGNFYTFSFYARQAADGDLEEVAGRVVLNDGEGNYLDLAGTSVAGDCAVSDWLSGTDNSVLIEHKVPEDTDYERYECVFTVPDDTPAAYAEVWLYSNDAYIDAVQLELGEDATSFVDGYNSSSPSTAYLLVPPDYLGCSGAATDPAECDNYTQVCTAQDVGCNLYAPEDGDPSVPAIASELDECPSECVGYTTYKQEATDREDEDFPLYFIADAATACSSQYVGCDAFTNLDAVESGGEGSESYTYLRACMTPEMTGTNGDDESATYFTWEGSDAAGYQLVTWTLLKSDDDDAPCTEWDVQGEDTLVCAEDASADYETDDCDQHDDIFDNPDCREFYDASGDIHYRDVTLTVAVDSECHPYRLDGSSETDCEASGGYWTDAGDCRYFGLSEESAECPATQAGCREYTGGAGRNASTVYEDDFEDGSLSEYYENAGVTSTVSNESLAVDGHSMRLFFASDSAVTTNMQFLDWSDTSLAYDGTDTTCSGIDSASHAASGSDCEIDYGTGNACDVAQGDNNCGALDDLLVSGKTYVLSFWAKGSDDLYVGFSDLGGTGDFHDLVDPTTPTTSDALALEGAWHQYTLGPLDTADLGGFDDSAILSFGASSGAIIYIDNVRLKAVEENIAIIKDSWVVPSTCDQTPDGADSDQYYLGCESYTDQDGNDADLYQFSDLCEEEVVGCEAVFDTQNSDSAFGMVYNARCEYVTNDPNDDDTVASNTDCELEDETACTISAGKSYCLFDRDGAIPSSLPYTFDSANSSYFYMTLGPEAVVVNADVPMYLVDNGTTSCTSENAGCEEIGLPTYSQDKSEVESFESAYYINDPDSYDDILCADEELFCEEWSSTQDGNFYFKDPVDQTCEYQTGVTIDGYDLYGWFRTDTSEPCYWTDTDGSGSYGPAADDAYLIGGEELGIWRNGDAAYAGWAATCPSSYDLCTEFRDVSDTSGTTYPAGTPFYFMDDDSLSEEALTASEQCNGQVSQKEGCALFYDTNDSELTYNTTASYVAATHADELFGDAPGSKQDPISCEDGGEDITTPDGETLNLCERRCYYETDDSDEIMTPSTQEISPLSFRSSYFSSPRAFLDASCYEDTDCPDLQTANGETVSGECVTAPDDLDVASTICMDPPCENPYALQNDANRVLKVYRDRECSAWLSCQSAQVSWNERTSRYETICDRVGLCTRYTRTGDTSSCTEWTEVDPVVLDAGEYAGRDVSWNGTEYSGYAIPDQLPVAHYDQINVAPDANDFICVQSAYDDGALPTPVLNSEGDFVDCEDNDDYGGICADLGSYVCRQIEQEFRLGYAVGSCDLAETGWLGECVVGHCEESGDSCASDGDCSGTEQCVIGYCQDVSTTVCYNDDDADGDGVDDDCDASFPTCDITLGACVDQLAPNSDTCVTDSDCSGSGTPTCTPDALSKTGSCVNNQCATDIYGEPLAPEDAEIQECRGYPESTSPFPSEVITEWRDPEDPSDDPSSTPDDYDWEPYSYTYGFETAETCSPVVNDAGEVVVTDDCVCSYDKVSYGTSSSVVRYYPPNTTLGELVTGDDNGDGSGDAGSAATGVCIGGSMAGQFCAEDGDCQADDSGYTGGSCAKFDRKDTVYGWNGYCLERDTSIQKNGSSDTSDRACITWLPVDQLSGATDLYGKYLGAGYNEGDTYYCAEIEVGYVLKSGQTFHTLASDNDCAAPTLNSCPDGTFLAVWDCVDDYEYFLADGSTSKHDAYEAMCVPMNSYIEGDFDRPCETGGSDHINVLEGGEETESNYADCVTPLLTSPSQVADWIDTTDNVQKNVEYTTSLSSRGVTVDGSPYCNTVVKVADSSSYNYAWTDRVFDKTGTQYEIAGIGNSADSYFEFTAETEQTVFGKADDETSSTPIDITASNESDPLSVLMCKLSDYSFVLPLVDGTCSSGDTTDDQHARAYLETEVLPAGEIYTAYGLTETSPTGTCTSDDDCAGNSGAFCAEGYCQVTSCDASETDMTLNGCNENVSCSGGSCTSGPREGATCETDEDCAIIACNDVYYSGLGTESDCYLTVPVVSPDETTDDVVERLSQFFAKSISLSSGAPWWDYSFGNDWTNEADPDDVSDFGAYEQQTSGDSWDVTATGDAYSAEAPNAPTIVSIGDCDGTECQEGSENHFSVNGVDSGDIEGAGGYKHVAVSFFAYADEEQMPLRNIVVDWGDDDSALNDDIPWDTGSQSGSTADDNFYQNHRGYDPDGDPICESTDSSASDWSYAPDACDTSYVTFVHDYVCVTGIVDDLPTCEITTDPNGLSRLVNSPCTGGDVAGSSGACVFQPRVYAEDNWGWCTGYCDSTDGIDVDGSGSGAATENATNGQCYRYECDVSDCPSEGASLSCSDYSDGYGGITNPWINYDGYVIVTP